MLAALHSNTGGCRGLNRMSRARLGESVAADQLPQDRCAAAKLHLGKNTVDRQSVVLVHNPQGLQQDLFQIVLR